MKKAAKWLSFTLAACTAGIYVFALYIGMLLPDTFLVTRGGELGVSGMPFVTAQKAAQYGTAATQGGRSGGDIQLSIGGIVPIKTVRAEEVSRRVVTMCGTPFGIKMFANGAMIVSFSDIYSGGQYVNPAKLAGLRLGDVIVSVAGRKTKTNEDLARSINDCKGAPVQIVYVRDGTNHMCTITAALDMAANVYRTGMWVRDSSAGIGTLTFVDNTTGVFAGLGHPIHDVDTGLTIGLDKGEIVSADIVGIVQGEAGTPGELKGRFSQGSAMGSISQNGNTGVYGLIDGYHRGVDMELALPQEVHSGEAMIITTIDGHEPHAYSVEIEKIDLRLSNDDRDMLIHITDAELLERTGGIVQGMSGSPLVQDGLLVGAVTHVMVGDPTRGYAIFGKTMLSTADGIGKDKKTA